MDWIKNNIIPFAPFITPVVGIIAIYFTFVQYRFQRRLNFIERQLDNFYAPLLGCIAYIDAHRHLRKDVFKHENEILSQNEIEYVPKLERDDYIKRSISYDNKLFIEKVLPKYKKMLDLFSEQNSYILPKTMQYFENLYRFVELVENNIIRKEKFILDEFYQAPVNKGTGNVKIFAEYRNKRIDATFDRETEKVFYAGGNYSVSSAADQARADLSGKKYASTDGWKFWKYVDEGQERNLDDLRKKN